MPYFLDGNNLIGHARGISRPSEEDRRALVGEIAARLRRTRARAVLFFDGSIDKASWLGNLEIREVGTSADDAIVAGVERARNSREILVVTADRALARRVREAGGRTLAPQEFWQSFGTKGERPGAEPAKVDVDEWIRYFEDEGNRER
ncbi:MAG: NYN domain-containing protein [Thermoanaerobaculia bacterium]